MRTGERGASSRGRSTKAARKSKSCGHFRGFLALAILPSAVSRSAYARSPSSPHVVTSLAFNSSPSIDLTGYRHSVATFPASWGPSKGGDMTHTSFEGSLRDVPRAWLLGHE